MKGFQLIMIHLISTRVFFDEELVFWFVIGQWISWFNRWGELRPGVGSIKCFHKVWLTKKRALKNETSQRRKIEFFYGKTYSGLGYSQSLHLCVFSLSTNKQNLNFGHLWAIFLCNILLILVIFDDIQVNKSKRERKSGQEVLHKDLKGIGPSSLEIEIGGYVVVWFICMSSLSQGKWMHIHYLLCLVHWYVLSLIFFFFSFL